MLEPEARHEAVRECGLGVGVERGDQRRRPVREERVIGVEQEHERRARLAEAAVARRGEAGVGAVLDELQAALGSCASRSRAHDLGRAVRGAVVDDDDLERPRATAASALATAAATNSAWPKLGITTLTAGFAAAAQPAVVVTRSAPLPEATARRARAASAAACAAAASGASAVAAGLGGRAGRRERTARVRREVRSTAAIASASGVTSSGAASRLRERGRTHALAAPVVGEQRGAAQSAKPGPSPPRRLAGLERAEVRLRRRHHDRAVQHGRGELAPVRPGAGLRRQRDEHVEARQPRQPARRRRDAPAGESAALCEMRRSQVYGSSTSRDAGEQILAVARVARMGADRDRAGRAASRRAGARGRPGVEVRRRHAVRARGSGAESRESETDAAAALWNGRSAPSAPEPRRLVDTQTARRSSAATRSGSSASGRSARVRRDDHRGRRGRDVLCVRRAHVDAPLAQALGPGLGAHAHARVGVARDDHLDRGGHRRSMARRRFAAAARCLMCPRGSRTPRRPPARARARRPSPRRRPS